MDNIKFKNFGLMVDCSRDACYTPATIEKFIDVISKMGYNLLMLYTEDTYELKDEKYFGYMRGRYTGEEIKRLDAYAKNKGVELVPCIQTLAHLSAMVRWQEYGEKCVDTDDILLVDEPATYELIDKMFAFAAENYASRKIHIGMDEAYAVGLGRYLNEHGYVPRYEILKKHLEKISEIADKYGFTCLFWSDMFVKTANDGSYYPKEFKLTDEIVAAVPDDMQPVYWDYDHTDKDHYDRMIKGHQAFGKELWFSGSAWTCLGFVPHNRTAADISGIALSACAENGVDNVLLTLWKDDGAESSLFAALPYLAKAACLSRGETDDKAVRELFKTATGQNYDDFMLLDLPDTGEENGLYNPSKYALYNDPFLGLLDYHLKSGKGKDYAKYAETLSKFSESGEYAYVFFAIEKLCRLLELKYDLGIKTRKAYKDNDVKTLERLADEIYPEAAKRADAFYDAFCRQWENECKCNGFEVHDIRLGGLSKRLRHCGRILRRYLDGEITKIEPLEEDVLPFYKNKARGEGLLYSIWMQTAMTKPWN